MNKSRQRNIALSCIRSVLRSNDADFLSISEKDALDILDDLARTEPDLIASIWYLSASENQVNLFKKEWNKMRVGWRELHIKSYIG